MPTLGFNSGNSNSSTSNSSTSSAPGQTKEVSLGKIVSQIIIKAILSFDDPVTNSSSGGSSGSSSSSSSQPQSQQSQPNSSSPKIDQVGVSSALTEAGGLSYGGGIRIGSGGVTDGLSAVGTTTIKDGSYQTSGGLTVGGLSANAGVTLNGGGLSFTGGIKQAQVGQGIVGPIVGSKIVGP